MYAGQSVSQVAMLHLIVLYKSCERELAHFIRFAMDT